MSGRAGWARPVCLPAPDAPANAVRIVDEIRVEAAWRPERQAFGRRERAVAAELLDEPGRGQPGTVPGVEADIAGGLAGPSRGRSGG